MATLAQAAVGLSKCVAAIGGNDCEYCQQQSTNNLSFMNQVVSLEKTNSTVGQSLAKTIANNFLNNVLRYRLVIYKGFVKNPPLLARERRSEERSGNIYEKYNCTGAGRPGGGGEYDVQVGLAPHFSIRMIILIFSHDTVSTVIFPMRLHAQYLSFSPRFLYDRKDLVGPMGWP